MRNKLFFASIMALFVLNTPVHAGGVSLGATRVVYQSDNKMKQVSLFNSDQKNQFLMQSWIEDEKGQLSRDLAVIPPLVLIKAASQNTTRLIRNNNNLPSDRETLYWLNVKAIPQKGTDSGKNTLQFAVTNRIKVFYRPTSLSEGAADAYRKVTFTNSNGKVNAINPTPYYITLTNISLNGKKVESLMLAPKETRVVGVGGATSIQADSVNDYGGLDHLEARTD